QMVRFRGGHSSTQPKPAVRVSPMISHAIRRVLNKADTSDRRGWCMMPDGLEVLDQIFQDLIADLQSMTMSDLESLDRLKTLSARRLAALGLAHVAIEAHESIPTSPSIPTDADLPKQWRRADELLNEALSWVPWPRQRHVWKTTQTYSRYWEHCELP